MSRPETVAYRMASLLAAIANCQQSGNTEWEQRHGETLEKLRREYLPSGSGIDSGTKLDLDDSTPEKLVLLVGFHHMDENGFYDGWTHHRIIARPSFVHGITLSISGPNRNDIKQYLHEVYSAALAGEVTP